MSLHSRRLGTSPGIVQLRVEGYLGSVLNGSPDLLSSTISNVMVIAAVLCVLGMFTAALRTLRPLMKD